ncbi:hypothetical protein FM125_06185 [Micrococcus lylae]|uniref:Uncharacterized protein n=1 Tax=Micrococcus lylae TaxID=1273 RepID=A0A1R4J398_9MICC|nr:hypothetical protein FM125_06185 [Micrococcus lylae]
MGVGGLEATGSPGTCRPPSSCPHHSPRPRPAPARHAGSPPAPRGLLHWYSGRRRLPAATAPSCRAPHGADDGARP